MDHLNSLAFDLSLTTLEKLIELFKDYICLFESDKFKIENAKRNSMLNDTCCLISDLIKLEIKNEDQGRKKKIKLFDLLNKSYEPPSLELSQEKRIKIIVNLIKNQDLLVCEASRSSRQIFIENSKKIIELLIDLPNQQIQICKSKKLDLNDLDFSKKKDENEVIKNLETTNKNTFANDNVSEKSNYDEITENDSDDENKSTDNESAEYEYTEDESTEDEFSDDQDQENNLNSLNKGVDNVQPMEVDQSLSVRKFKNQQCEVHQEFKFEGMSSFLRSQDSVLYSKVFMCGGVHWFLEICSSKHERRSRNVYKFLTIGLVREKMKYNSKRALVANFKIKILNNHDNKNDKVEVFKNYLFESGETLKGFYENRFINYAELMDGFIRDDSIRISIDLRVEKKRKTKI